LINTKLTFLIRPAWTLAPLLALGGLLAAAFTMDFLQPVRWGVALLFALLIPSLLGLRLTRFSPLGRLMVVIYFAPFLVCWNYLLDPEFTWWDTEMALDYMQNPTITAGMIMVGVIGLAGLLAGLWLAAALRLRPDAREVEPPARKGLEPLWFALLLGAGVAISYLASSDDTIFTALYTAAPGWTGRMHFNAAFLLSYTILVLLFVDSEQEAHGSWPQKWKRGAVCAATAVVVVFFQLLHGDREAFGLVVALGGLYVTESPALEAKAVRRLQWVRIGGIAAAVAMLFPLFLWVGEVRTQWYFNQPVTVGEGVSGGFKRSTWTSVLLTNLSLAAQYHEGRMPFEYGQTYLDYFFSLPPGFITRPLGIERPVETGHGPADWFTDVSSGGIHVVAVPFRNFGAAGVFLVLLLYGWLIGKSELWSGNGRWTSRFWYGCMFVTSAHWFWYGDMNLIREVMAFFLVMILYRGCRLLTVVRKSLPADEEPRTPGENRPNIMESKGI